MPMASTTIPQNVRQKRRPKMDQYDVERLTKAAMLMDHIRVSLYGDQTSTNAGNIAALKLSTDELHDIMSMLVFTYNLPVTGDSFSALFAAVMYGYYQAQQQKGSASELPIQTTK